jgi:hypothetical protein
LIRLKTPKLNPEGINVSKELSAKLAPLAAPAESPWLRATGILLGGSALAAI